jgi:cytochrome c553
MPQLSGRVLCAVFLAAVAISGRSAFAEDAAIEEKVKLCATCHGENGVPINETTPVIWG